MPPPGPTVSPARAAYTDAAGITHHVEFIGSNGHRIFAARTSPRDSSAAVLLCSPILAEFPKNYRREVLLARALAAAGVTAQRFHYRGAGHSDGDSSVLTLATMKEDALTAIEHLVGATRLTHLGFVGTRLGAVAAATVAASVDGAPLVLWDPVIEPVAYVAEVLEHRLVTASQEDAAPQRAQSGLSEPGVNQPIDVVGYSVEETLAESISAHRLEAELGDRTGPTLVVQLDETGQLRDDCAQLVERWRAAGSEVDTAIVDPQQGWWSLDDPRLKDRMLLEGTPLIGLTAEWLGSHLAAPAVPT